MFPLNHIFHQVWEAIQERQVNVQSSAADRETNVKFEIDGDLYLVDDVPAEAQVLIRRIEKAVAQARRETQHNAEVVRAQADKECEAIRRRAEAMIAQSEAEKSRELTPQIKVVIDQLKQMQRSYTREGLLDEALAIRAQLRKIRADLFGVENDPGSMSDKSSSDVGRSYLYEVVGSTEGMIWGTGRYTADSVLSVAAVHAGALRDGERGILRVTMVESQDATFESTEQHGVSSMEYTGYSLGYTIERI